MIWYSCLFWNWPTAEVRVPIGAMMAAEWGLVISPKAGVQLEKLFEAAGGGVHIAGAVDGADSDGTGLGMADADAPGGLLNSSEAHF